MLCGLLKTKTKTKELRTVKVILTHKNTSARKLNCITADLTDNFQSQPMRGTVYESLRLFSSMLLLMDILWYFHTSNSLVSVIPMSSVLTSFVPLF